MTRLNQSEVPNKMRALPNWVSWKLVTGPDGNPTKPPFIVGSNQHASATDPSSWRTYGIAKANTSLNGKQGIGFAFGKSRIAGVDIDGCRNPETREEAPWLDEFLNALPDGAYTEVSPSGFGVKVFVEGELPPGCDKVLHLDPSKGYGGKVQIEFLGEGRYSTVTEDGYYDDLGDVVPCDLAAVYRVADALRKKYPAVSNQPNAKVASPKSEVVKLKTGGRELTSKLELLMHGTVTSKRPFVVSDEFENSAEYSSQSQADLALANLLAFKHEGDAAAIDQDFRKSILFREKWLRQDYREKTIKKAVEDYKKTKPGTAIQTAPTSATAEEPIEVLEIDEALEFPDMPEDAVSSGVLGNICRQHFQNFPLAYAWPSLLTVAGAMVPPPAREHLEVLAESAGVGSQTNLYTALVGPVGSGKSQSIEYAIGNLGLPRTKHQPVKAGSMEGLLRKLAKGAAPLATAQHLIDLDEWSFFFKKAGIENSSFVDHLNSGFNKPQFRLTIAKGEEIYLDAALSFIGGIVTDRFQNCFGEESMGGFHDRFLFGICPTKNPFVFYPFDRSESARTNPVFSGVTPVRVAIDKSVWRLVQDWRLKDPTLGRSAEVTVRCCAIVASFDGRDRIFPKDLEAMRPFLEYQIRCPKKLHTKPGTNN